MGVDLVVERDHLQNLEKLALILVDALDLHVEKRIRIDFDEKLVRDELCESLFVRMAYARISRLEIQVVCVFLKALESIRIVQGTPARSFPKSASSVLGWLRKASAGR